MTQVDAKHGIAMAVLNLVPQEKLTSETIRQTLAFLNALPAHGFDPSELESIARQIEASQQITMNDGSTLIEHSAWKPWLQVQKSEIDPYYWLRYEEYLHRTGLPPKVVAKTDEITDNVLDLLENPHKGTAWDRRGLVVGHVQSGKTANYIGLVCKAADAGFKVIIIVAGIHNNLRNQTQRRVDEGFIGRDSLNAERSVGVGEISKHRRPMSFTNADRDFSKMVSLSVASLPLQGLNEPAVFVVKKNASTLRHLISWLGAHNARQGTKTINYPMLLIDDEADNASINTRANGNDPSTINKLLRELLSLFEQSAYVGYTATPFANIFIDPETSNDMVKDDLFPRDFIVSLDPPSNYFGPEAVFLDTDRNPSPLVEIEDAGELLPVRHDKNHRVSQLPESLKDAIRTFVLSRAVRIVRGDANQHTSMLVNASRFNAVQRDLRSAIHIYVTQLQAALRIHGRQLPDRALVDPDIGALRRTWNEHYRTLPETWLDIFDVLYEAATPIQVVEVNSGSTGRLNYHDYEDGMSVIAVGGYALSRGLTLEGLTISYYLRNSVMYDTLMQMGRWFGYRPHYEDLCRIWMTPESAEWYVHVAEATEELREDLRRMQAAGGTPRDFGLKVRSHPTTLIVTARNKMGSGQKVKVDIALSNKLVETTVLQSRPDILAHHFRAARKLMDRIGPVEQAEGAGDGDYLFRNVPATAILEFLSAFSNHPLSPLSEPESLIRYIGSRATDELANWDVLVAGTLKGDQSHVLGFPVRMQVRAIGEASRGRPNTIYIGERRRVSSRGVEKKGLSPEAIARAERQYEISEGMQGRSSKNIPDRVYRAERRGRPMLVLHLLKLRDAESMNIPREVLAWSISFPPSDIPDEITEYVVNTQYFRDMFMETEADEDADIA